MSRFGRRLATSIATAVVLVIPGSWTATRKGPDARGLPGTLASAAPQHGALLFGDEFDGAKVNGRMWNFCHWWGPAGCTLAGNHELEWYLPGQAEQRMGSLRLTAIRQPVRTPDGSVFAFRSGMVSTGRASEDVQVKPKFSFQYGYVEARVRVPRGAGLWPALWLLPVSNRSLPEIDIAEIRGSDTRRLSMHLHTADASGDEHAVGEHWAGADLASGWHTFALYWRAGSLRWLIDGTEAWRLTGAQVPAEPMYLIANLAVGGDWPGPPTASTSFPAAFELDYVRVWGVS